MTLKPIGLWIGLILGVAWAAGGFAGACLAAFLGAIGFVIEKIINGEIDFSDYIGNREN